MSYAQTDAYVDLARLLAHCPRCGASVLLTYGEASYRSLRLFDSMPWSPLDETAPQGLTAAGLTSWRRGLPYRLAIAYIDLARGTWQLAMVWGNEKLRARPLFKLHDCDSVPPERSWPDGSFQNDLQPEVESLSTHPAPDHDPVADCARAQRRAMANDRRRARYSRPVRRHPGGV